MPTTTPAPEVVSTARQRSFSKGEQNKVWSWDVRKLKRPDRGTYFSSLTDPRAYCGPFFACYNPPHRHSGIGMLTPESVRTGRAAEVRKTKKNYAEERFREQGRLRHIERIGQFGKRPLLGVPFNQRCRWVFPRAQPHRGHLRSRSAWRDAKPSALSMSRPRS